jgi:hypothetical protein
MKTLILLLFPFITFAQIQNSKAEAAVKSGTNPESSVKQWSFGVLYVPYYSGTVYRVYNYQYPSNPDIYSVSENKTDLEAELTYGFPDFRFSLSAGYSSSYEYSNHQEHEDYFGSQSASGYVNTMGLKLLDFTIGFKSYFGDLLPERVSIYAEAGLGKQIAFANNNYEQLFVEPQPGEINEDNSTEYIEELNSPWHLNFGFGAEYLFNESLSLKSDIRVLYSSVAGDFTSRHITENNNHYVTEERTFRYFTTKIGLGLNFYF